MRRMKEIIVFEAEQFDDDWPTNTAADFLYWISKKIAEIPAEFLESAKVEIDGGSGYGGGGYASLTIKYSRPETDDEYRARKDRENFGVRQSVIRERMLYEILKAKYDKTPGKEPTS